MARLPGRLLPLVLTLLLLLATRPAQAQSNSTTSLRTSASPSSSTSSSSIVTPSSTISSSTPSSTPSPPAMAERPFLAAKVEGWSGALGGILILSGLALAGAGVKSRWTSFFLIGAFSAMVPIACLILHFGVEPAIYPPSQSTRGLYLFACLAGGAITGAACIIWTAGATYLCGALGSFAVAIWLQCLRSDGLIQVAYGKWILIVGFSALGFAASCAPRLHHAMVLFASASVGSTALVLGVDCFTSSNLKEFYVYNLGLPVPRRLTNFPLTTALIVELAVIGALFLCSVAFQWKGYTKIVARVRELQQADLERARREDMHAQRRRLSGVELQQWEEKHGRDSGLWGKASEETLSALPANPSQIKKGSMVFLPELGLVGAKQSSAPAATATPSKWSRYLSSRTIFVDDREKPKPTPRPSPVALEEGCRNPAAALPMPRPLSTVLPRSPSPAAHSQPLSSATLSPLPRPISSSYGFPEAPSRPRLPRNSSALSRPLSLIFPSTAALNTLGAIPADRRRTMVDLAADDDLPLGEAVRRERRRTMQGVGAVEERVIVADWKRKEISQPKATKLMDMAELEAKKRKALAEIQGKVTAEARANALKLEHEQRRQSAASVNALKTARRGSVGTLLDRLGAGSPSPSPSMGEFGEDSATFGTGQFVGERGRTRSVPLSTRKDFARISGDKVEQWRRRSSVMDELPARKVEPSKPAKKHDWLGY